MKILLTGATGFVGGEIMSAALWAGHEVRVLARQPARAASATGKPGVGIFHGNILEPASLAGCMEGVDAVVHLVGIIAEANEMTYDRVHRQGTLHLLAEAKRAKVKRWLQMSALGARPEARSRYHQSKWAAEEAVRASGLDWTIFRPSIIYGRKDQFVNVFARMMRLPMSLIQGFTVPVFGGGFSRLQPVRVEDVATCFVQALGKAETAGRIYDLCGPEPLRFRTILEQIAAAIDKKATLVPELGRRSLGDWAGFLLPLSILVCLGRSKPLLVPVPWDFARALAFCLETVMERPPFNRDQLLMLEEDNVGDPDPAAVDFGVRSPPFRDGIAACLSR